MEAPHVPEELGQFPRKGNSKDYDASI